MTTAIVQLAAVELPSGLLQQFSINEILERFRATYSRLDDLKKVRDRHEQRSFLGRLFKGGELKDAQLDAQELQAEFSKTLAQLMIMVTLQAQQLTEQQAQLSRHQKDLKDKAQSLSEHNTSLEQHQAEIHAQAAEMKDLVNGLLKVNGLTEDHAIVLIRMAEEVSGAKQELINRVEQHTCAIRAELQRANADQAAQLLAQAQVAQQRHDLFAASLLSLRDDQQESRTHLQAAIEEHRQRADHQHRQLQTQWKEEQAALRSSVRDESISLQQTFSGQLTQAVAEHADRLGIETAERIHETEALRMALASFDRTHTESATKLHRHFNRLFLVLVLIISGCAGMIVLSYLHTNAAVKGPVHPMSGAASGTPALEPAVGGSQ